MLPSRLNMIIGGGGGGGLTLKNTWFIKYIDFILID